MKRSKWDSWCRKRARTPSKQEWCLLVAIVLLIIGSPLIAWYVTVGLVKLIALLILAL